MGDKLLSDNEINEIRGRLKRATPGPWAVYDNGFDVYISAGVRKAKAGEKSTFNCGIVSGVDIFGGEPAEGAVDPNDPNVIFTINAPTDIANLLAEIDRLREELFYIKKAIGGAVVMEPDALRKIVEGEK